MLGSGRGIGKEGDDGWTDDSDGDGEDAATASLDEAAPDDDDAADC